MWRSQDFTDRDYILECCPSLYSSISDGYSCENHDGVITSFYFADGHDQLAKSAKLAIGISVSVGVIFLAILAFWLFRIRQRKRRRQTPRPDDSGPNEVDELDSTQVAKAELSSGVGVSNEQPVEVELDNKPPEKDLPELASDPVVRELGAERETLGPPHPYELDAYVRRHAEALGGETGTPSTPETRNLGGPLYATEATAVDDAANTSAVFPSTPLAEQTGVEKEAHSETDAASTSGPSVVAPPDDGRMTVSPESSNAIRSDKFDASVSDRKTELEAELERLKDERDRIRLEQIQKREQDIAKELERL